MYVRQGAPEPRLVPRSFQVHQVTLEIITAQKHHGAQDRRGCSVPEFQGREDVDKVALVDTRFGSKKQFQR